MFVVTGASGQTGSVVANHLLAAGKKVRAICRDARHLQALTQKGAEPFTADLTNREALAQAFSGAEGVYVMNPPDPTAPDYRTHQDAVTEAVAAALESARVKHAVALSSFGADKPDKTGPVVGLHLMEERLNRISGLTVLHLRPGYFMENTLVQAEIIRQTKSAIAPLSPDLKIAMIATRDIGTAAAEALLHLNFETHETRELLGPRDITMQEVAGIIGKAIGIPELKYVQPPVDQVRAAMLQMGMSANLVDLILEMADALNSGYMKPLEQRGPRNTTPTTYETFVQEEFLPRYRAAKAA